MEKELLSFDDVLLVPQYSTIQSRNDVDISTKIIDINLKVPIISANMDSVTGYPMVLDMYTHGGLGILRRYVDLESILKSLDYEETDILQCLTVIPTVGVNTEDYEWVNKISKFDEQIEHICVDIAHGDSIKMEKMLRYIKNNTKLKIIAGNVCTYSGAMHLMSWGADCVKVGVGPGSVCSTRIVTGHGIPQLSAIIDCNRIREVYPNASIIADGGIRNSGDIVKSLAAGADAVMCGMIFAKTKASEAYLNSIIDESNEIKYAGMASNETRKRALKGEVDAPEGVEISFEKKEVDTVENVIKKLSGGIRSGCSYSGATNLQELRDNHVFVRVSSNSLLESVPHAKLLSQK